MGRFNACRAASQGSALGNATGKAVHQLTEIIVAAPVDEDEREQWLQRLRQAIANDGVDYLAEVRERWGELCGSAERAAREADELLPTVRYQELLDLIDEAPFLWWHYRRFGVRALEAMGKIDEAIEYAQLSRGLNDPPALIARACEAILLRAGMTMVELANAVGTKYPNISAVENDRRAVGLDMARKLGSALNCDYRKFLDYFEQ